MPSEPHVFRRVGHALALLIGVVLLCSTARAQEVLKFDETRVNLGTISDDQSQIHAFHFTNISGRRIRVAMSYCHFCSPPILDKSVLQPGESGTVVVELDPTGRRGQYAASVSVAEEGKPGTRVEIELKAEVCPRIWVEPTSMFPRITHGRGATGSFSVVGRTKGFKVLRIESDVPMDGFDFGPVVDFEEFGSPAHKQEVTVHFPKDAPIGPFAANLRVVTSDEDAPKKGVSVSGQVVGQIDHSPETIRFAVKPGEPFRTTFDIVAEEGPVIVHSLDITDRDECTSVALDVAYTPDPARVRVTISGIAPMRERQMIAINVRAVASTLSMGGEETHNIPVMMVARFPAK
jgi:hypothetical protein